MYEVIKSVISAGGYKLADIQYKIKKLYMWGDLEEAQTDELLALAAGGVSTDAERPETLAMIKTLSVRIKALEDRVKALENGDGAAGPEVEQTEYPAWEPWDGISDKYQFGAIVKESGVLWISDFRGQNVWKPGAPGTEALWLIYTPET